VTRKQIIFLKIVQISHQELMPGDKHKIRCKILIILKLIKTLKEQIYLNKDRNNFQIFLLLNLHQVIKNFKIVKIKELLPKINGKALHQIDKQLIDFLYSPQRNRISAYKIKMQQP
jgi:hypothetical protein